MEKYIKILILLQVFYFTSCENIGIIEEDLPYVHLYEIDGAISPGDKSYQITITQSLPLNEIYNINRAAITDANAYLWSDNQGIIPLKHIGNGKYQPAKSKSDKLQIKADTYYELFVDINGNRIYSKTKVPSPPVILNAKIVQDHIECKVSGKEGEVYSCIYIIVDGVDIGLPRVVEREKEFISVVKPGNDGTVTLQTGSIPGNYLHNSNFQIGIEVYAWDEAYKDYFETKDNNKPVGDVFSQGGDLIKWNVYGENTIGLFIGYSTTIYYNF